MFEITMIIMAKSSKFGQYCVAGINYENGEWVRLVTAGENENGKYKDGPISRKFLTDKNGYVCGCLDVIKVKCIEYTFDSIQPENVLVAEREQIEYMYTVELKNVLDLHPCEKMDYIFADTKPYLCDNRMNELDCSLVLVKVQNLKVYKVTNSYGQVKTKVDFWYEGKYYNKLSVTDSDYYDLDDIYLKEGVLVISIGKNFRNCMDHYKFVSKIYA